MKIAELKDSANLNNEEKQDAILSAQRLLTLGATLLEIEKPKS